jgi:hypothetical protein
LIETHRSRATFLEVGVLLELSEVLFVGHNAPGEEKNDQGEWRRQRVMAQAWPSG